MKETITPAEAREMLHAVHYKHIHPDDAASLLSRIASSHQGIDMKRAEKLAEFLKARTWIPSACLDDPIKIDKHGRVEDGVQRLMAVIISDIPVAMWVKDESQ